MAPRVLYCLEKKLNPLKPQNRTLTRKASSEEGRTMAAMKLLLSQARRQGLIKPFSSPFQLIPRLFSSSSSSDSNPNPPLNETRKKLEPVSYAAKPKSEVADGASPPSSYSTPLQADSAENRQPPRSPESANQEDRSTLTREEIRYVKDAPSITPVSYAYRVAPLPEDRIAGEGEGERTPEEMEIERKRIEAENRARRRFLRANAVEEDTSSLPLPTLLKPDLKHGKKPIFDLMEAIREIKVRIYHPHDS